MVSPFHFEGVSLSSIFIGVAGRAEFNAILAFGHKNNTQLSLRVILFIYDYVR